VGKGQFGFLESKGNSDAESINGAIEPAGALEEGRYRVHGESGVRVLGRPMIG
jgi:hypothetical protein